MAETEFLEKGAGDFQQLYKALNIDISFYKPKGSRSLETYLPHFLPTQSVILVHNVNTNKEDLQFIGHPERPEHSQRAGKDPERPERSRRIGVANVYFCLCPNANEYIGNALPDIDLLRQYQAMITIGTDSLASNHQLSVLAELETIQDHYPHIELKELLTWATINGARALQLDNLLGSFEAGKQPGVLVINDNLTEVTRIL
jgi:cytosine/adenosine deaminase-related metal-dependent hydrolase